MTVGELIDALDQMNADDDLLVVRFQPDWPTLVDVALLPDVLRVQKVDEREYADVDNKHVRYPTAEGPVVKAVVLR